MFNNFLRPKCFSGRVMYDLFYFDKPLFYENIFILNLFFLSTGPGGPCRTGQYVCDDGSCARQGSGCNGRTECRDGSDEFPKYCGCPSLRQFQCRDGTKCIDAMQECDGITDCTDRSDEHSRCGEYSKSIHTFYLLLQRTIEK